LFLCHVFPPLLPFFFRTLLCQHYLVLFFKQGGYSLLSSLRAFSLKGWMACAGSTPPCVGGSLPANGCHFPGVGVPLLLRPGSPRVQLCATWGVALCVREDGTGSALCWLSWGGGDGGGCTARGRLPHVPPTSYSGSSAT
jgi:hypothetical protein